MQHFISENLKMKGRNCWTEVLNTIGIGYRLLAMGER